MPALRLGGIRLHAAHAVARQRIGVERLGHAGRREIGGADEIFARDRDVALGRVALALTFWGAVVLLSAR